MFFTRMVVVIFTLVLACVQSLAQADGVSVQAPVQAASQPGNKAMDLLVLKPVPDSEALIDAQLVLGFRRASFSPQFGIGLSGIPILGTWDLQSREFRYQGGLGLDFLWRVQRFVTLQLGAVGVISNQGDALGALYKELGVFVGFRFFMFAPKPNCFGIHLVPYVTMGPMVDSLYPSIHREEKAFSSFRVTDYPLLYAGAFLGFGFEFRLGRHLSVTADVRGMVQGAIDALGSDGKQHATRLGLRATVGLATYF